MTEVLSLADYRALVAKKQPRAHKYNAKPVRAGDRADGLTFASQAEAKRYDQLRLLERAGQVRIGSIELHPVYELWVNGHRIGRYTGDFRYVDAQGVMHVEDVKGERTREFIRAKKLMRAIYGIEVEEVGERRRKPRARARFKRRAKT